MENLTEKQAYIAMYIFWDELYQRTKSDDLGGFLGSMSLLEDGFPADKAMWGEWLDAIQKAKDDRNEGVADLKK